MNVLLTGAARGMGLGICEHLAARGDTVFATCRKVSDELKAIVAKHPGRVKVIDGVDVAEDASIARMKAGIGDAKIDAVICNAAINASFEIGRAHV